MAGTDRHINLIQINLSQTNSYGAIWIVTLISVRPPVVHHPHHILDSSPSLDHWWWRRKSDQFYCLTLQTAEVVYFESSVLLCLWVTTHLLLLLLNSLWLVKLFRLGWDGQWSLMDTERVWILKNYFLRKVLISKFKQNLDQRSLKIFYKDLSFII